MFRSRAAALAVVLVASLLVVGGPGPQPARSAPVVPTQWIARIATEAFGRAPTDSEWNFWLAYYRGQPACTKDTLATLGRAAYQDARFTDRYPEPAARAARVLALVRGVYGHEPNGNDWTAYFEPYAAGARTWSQIVDAIFDNGVFATFVVPGICAPGDPGAGFGGPVLDVNPRSGGPASRTQRQLQEALDAAAPSCGTVTLQPREVVRIGGDQPGAGPDRRPLAVPPCVTLTTAGAPAAEQYASMGRLVAGGSVCEGSTCDHLELVRLGDGARLSHVWVDGKGADPESPRLGLVGVASGTAASRLVDSRLSDPPAGGTAVRLTGHATTGTACANRLVARNLITGYAGRHGQDRFGQTLAADGIAVHCEQATVAGNQLVDVSDLAIVAYGSWHSGIGNSGGDGRRTQRSTVTGNRILSAGVSGQVALAADPTGECLADDVGPPVSCIEFSHDRTETELAERSFAGTSFEDNRFWTGSRTHFDIGLLVGGRASWGDNSPFGRGARFTGNTTGAATARVNTGILVSGMLDTFLTGNTGSYPTLDTNPRVTELKCPRGSVLFGFLTANFDPGTTPQPGTWVNRTQLANCLAPHPPPDGMAPITTGGSGELEFAGTGVRFHPWGHNASGSHEIEVVDLRELRQTGANTIRIHPQFRDLMASCTAADPAAIDQLRTTVRRAEENGVYLYLTGLGSWAGDPADPACYRDATEEQRWAAQAAFWQAVAGAVQASPAVLALDLMNEPTVPSADTPCWVGPDPDGQPPNQPGCSDGFGGSFFVQNLTRTPDGRSSGEIAQAWLTRMTQAIRAVNQDHLITLGCLSFTNCGVRLTPAQLATQLDLLSVHVYPRDCTGEPPPEPPDPCGFQRAPERASGDPLTYERNLLTAFAAPGKPVIVAETFPLAGPPELVRQFLVESHTAGRATGWFGHAQTITMSQIRADPDQFPWLYYFWFRIFQRLTPTISPCGTCQP